MTERGAYLFPIAITLGALLTLLGPTAYLASDSRHWTAFIPTLLGLIILALGIVGRRSENRQRTYASCLGAIGLIAALGSARALPAIATVLAGGTADSPTATIAQSITLLIGLILVAATAKHLLDTRAAT